MAAPLNLTLKRGPSVWDDRTTAPSDFRRVYGVAAGVGLAMLALQSRPSRRWLLGLAAGVSATSLLAGRFSTTFKEGARQLRNLRGVPKDHAVDRASEDSFPASDPPSQHR